MATEKIDKTKEEILEDEIKKDIKEPDIKDEPKINLEELTKTLTERIKLDLEDKIKKEKEEELTQLTKTFEDKLNELKSESAKEKDNYIKLIEGLKTDKDIKNVIKQIEDHNIETKKVQELKEALEIKNKAEEEKEKALTALQELKQKMADKEREDKLKSEQLEFKNKLLQEANDKPHIADKINKILQKEDFETQKSTYLTVLDFFDTDEEKERFEAKKRAGTSAFKGVKVSDDGGSDDDLKSFNKKYIEDMLNKVKGKRNPNKK